MRNGIRLLIATAGAFAAITAGSVAANASTGPVIHHPVQGTSYQYGNHQNRPAQPRDCIQPYRFRPQVSQYLYPGYPECYPQPVRDPRPVRQLHRVNAWESFSISEHGNSPYQPATASGLLVSGPGYFTQSGRTETGHFGGATFTVVTAGGNNGTFTVTSGTGRLTGLSGTGTYSASPSGPRSRHGETITAEGTFSQISYAGHLL